MKQTRIARKRKKKIEQRGKKEEGTTISHIKARHSLNKDNSTVPANGQTAQSVE